MYQHYGETIGWSSRKSTKNAVDTDVPTGLGFREANQEEPMTTDGRGGKAASDFKAFVYGRKHTLKTLAEASGVKYWKLRQHSAGIRALDRESLETVAEILGVGPGEVPIPTLVVQWQGGGTSAAA
jgi:hypothetical protein